jgi:hypothetical protein
MKKYTDDEALIAAELNGSFAKSLRQTGQVEIAQLQDRAVTPSSDGGQFVDAYTDATSQNNSVTVANTSAVFDTDKYKAITSSTEPLIIIEATSISAVADFAINDCQIMEVSSGTWQLICDTGTDEVKRAQIYKTLFYGSDGTNPRATSTYITGITALKTSVARDVGKKAYLAIGDGGPAGAGTAQIDTATVDITFNDTTNNTDFSSWSKCVNVELLTSNDATGGARWEVPSATLLNGGFSNSSTSSDETGTDLTADELDNPATAQLDVRTQGSSTASGGQQGDGWAYFLYAGTLSVTPSTSGTGSPSTSTTDFNIAESVPAMTATTEDVSSFVEHVIPAGTFISTLSTAFMTFKADDWESGADVQFKLTNATEDTGWLDTNETVTFTALTAEPDNLIVNVIPKTTSPTANYPSINGVALYGDKP